MAEKYISVEALFEKTTRRNHIWDAVTNAEGKGLTEIVNDIPPADVRPVVHGSWRAVSFHEVACTKCGYVVDIMKADVDHMKFYNECGADMRPEPPEREVEA